MRQVGHVEPAAHEFALQAIASHALAKAEEEFKKVRLESTILFEGRTLEELCRLPEQLAAKDEEIASLNLIIDEHAKTAGVERGHLTAWILRKAIPLRFTPAQDLELKKAFQQLAAKDALLRNVLNSFAKLVESNSEDVTDEDKIK